jgi:hypothetical protein
MESEILFIGGCEDGRRHMVDGMDRVKMPQYNADGTVTAIEYRRERMLCEDVPFAVMVVDGMSMVTAMQNLLEGYKSNAPAHRERASRDTETTPVGAGESSPAPDGSALVEALRDTHRHIEELERIQTESPRCVMTHEAKERAKRLTERIIALSQNEVIAS